jgi:hypothetical protein
MGAPNGEARLDSCQAPKPWRTTWPHPGVLGEVLSPPVPGFWGGVRLSLTERNTPQRDSSKRSNRPPGHDSTGKRRSLVQGWVSA